ncbi:MAG: hypothetical protein JOY63_16585 [Acetobacteraceae bacterium]|nr:hypothetical protein [Acetobacteraceae bacterium]
MPVGSYRYPKRLAESRVLDCEVKVFALRVTRLLDTWPASRPSPARWPCGPGRCLRAN